uniref:Uncharacterized protein n=1 Tax=Vitis vinifera TaxID=29760 RepID=A5C6P5_VITVI|nr:hypothetical protein VITISV_018456 [Vitis vinifera]
MAKTRGVHAVSPSTRNPRPRASPVRDSTSEALQAPAIPPSEGGMPSNHPQRRYETRKPLTTPGASTSRPKRSICRPPAKKAKVSGLGESFAPPQPQPPATESQIPYGMTLEAIIRHALDFYQSMTTRHVRNPNVIHFTIDGCHGILGARHIAEALHIPYEPVSPADFKEWSHFSQRDMVRILSRGTSTRSFLLRKEFPPGMLLCLGIEFQSQKFGVKSEELVVERSLKLDALNLNWLGVINGPPLHGQFRKEYL